ncbi:alanyl-tRNA synthetase [uncultured Desulfobacterium sp.]|uniref:Alanine--tRNA ligase n=1 Tax=uncultured Desulfobacterium sp. TaxID=201089 RepID=A0A445N266_9BACT|nr:alanyl-tRNA synthetase [uncultured Desulfobacterium sp.]
MDSREIRYNFLDYFKKQGHEIVASSSLIPKDDPTLLFTNAGMVQFKGLFLGEEKRGYARAASSQKCVRAGGKHNDLENVGYTARHHTFFEMLGNFSFGDYFKEEAITWAWELLTVGYKLPDQRLYVSVYKDDDEAYRIWQDRIGLPQDRIIRLGDKDNFWAMGDTGPCGPCSEILIDQGPSVGCGRPDCAPGCDCDRYLEIWNLVFTQFDRAPDGKLVPLPRPNIDTGMGLERLAAVVQGKTSNYDSDIFRRLISGIEEVSGKKYGQEKKSNVAFRVIADHARSTAFLIGDGIMPSNEGRGYVLRRIIRRAIRFGHVLGLTNSFLRSMCTKVIETMGQDYNELFQSQGLIEGVVENEERRFADTLHFSIKVLDEEIARIKSRGDNQIPGEMVFKLYDTYGLPADIVEDIARDERLGVDMDGYNDSMSRQKSMSQESWKGSGEKEIPEIYRNLISKGITTTFIGYDSEVADARAIAVLSHGTASVSANDSYQAEVVLDKTPFYGEAGGQVGDIGVLENEGTVFEVIGTARIGHGLVVHRGHIVRGSLSEGDRLKAKVNISNRKATACNHSATHLLHKALRDILGEHVKQAGSLVTASRLRFDFSHFTQVSSEKLTEVERQVNAYIRNNMPICTEEMTKDDAMKTGAMAIFEERYGDTVRVVNIGDGISMELCGGTHTARTGDIGLFRIVSESAVAANVRRIEALTGDEALSYDQRLDNELKFASSLLKTSQDKVTERIERILAESKEKDKEIEVLKAKLLSNKSDDFLSGIREIGGVKVLAAKIDADSQKELRDSADKIKDRLGSGIIVLGSEKDGKAMLICMVTKDLIKRFQAGKIISRLSEIVGGKGGGRPDMAQGGGADPAKLAAALDELYVLMGKAEG